MCFSFFFHHPSTTEIYTLSLHDALPILLKGASYQARDSLSWRLKDSHPSNALSVRLMPSSLSSSRVDRKSTRLNSSHSSISYAVFCLKKKKLYVSVLVSIISSLSILVVL